MFEAANTLVVAARCIIGAANTVAVAARCMFDAANTVVVATRYMFEAAKLQQSMQDAYLKLQTQIFTFEQHVFTVAISNWRDDLK